MELKDNINKVLEPFKKSPLKPTDECVVCKVKSGSYEKSINALSINKILSKSEELEVYFVDENMESPLFIKDKNSDVVMFLYVLPVGLHVAVGGKL